MCVEGRFFFKINKRDSTFIREMRVLNGMQVITSRVARLPDKEPFAPICMYITYVRIFEFITAPIKNFRQQYLTHFTNFCIKWCMSVRLGAITKYETTTLAFSQKTQATQIVNSVWLTGTEKMFMSSVQ